LALLTQERDFLKQEIKELKKKNDGREVEGREFRNDLVSSNHQLKKLQ